MVRESKYKVILASLCTKPLLKCGILTHTTHVVVKDSIPMFHVRGTVMAGKTGKAPKSSVSKERMA